MNSTPPSPTSTMRLTALLPPPPTPITLIFAPRRASGASVMRRSEASRSRAIAKPSLKELFENAPDAPRHPAERTRAAFGVLGRPVLVCVQRQPHGGRKYGARHVIGQPADAGWMAAADRQVEDLLGNL